MNIQQSIQKLSSILPIKKSLDALQKPGAEMYFAILNGFYQQGRAPLMEELESKDPEAREHLTLLATKDMLTLDENGEIRGCYPFTMQKRVHRVALNGHEMYAMCALDALAPALMFNTASTVLSECAMSAKPVKIELQNSSVLNSQEVAELHVGINWLAACSTDSCSNSLCTEMLYLISRTSAQHWLQEDPTHRDIYTLDEAIEFATGFFKPMLEQNTVNDSQNI